LAVSEGRDEDEDHNDDDDNDNDDDDDAQYRLHEPPVVRPQTRLLLAGAAAAATTANAIRPPRRVPALSIPSFACGLPVSELPLDVGLLELASLLALSRGEATRGWQGKVGVAAFAASLAGLTFVQRKAAEARPILEAALVEALGPGYRESIGDSFRPRDEVSLTRQQLLVPDMRVRKRYRAARDVPYGDAAKRNWLDVWRRADLPTGAKAPVLVQIPGGGWTTGRKEGQAEPLMGHLAERGWVCVTANYRLSPQATWPDHIVDVKRALAWTKATIADHGGDPSFIAITGGSAGGHLSSLAALTSQVPEFQPGFEDADTSVAAAVPLYGVYDFTNRYGTGRTDMEPFLSRFVFKSNLHDDRPRWEQASSISHVGPDAPPFFVIHGTNDSLVPVEQARTFVDQLRAVSRERVAYAEIPGAQHAFEAFPSVRAVATVHAIERFLASVRSEHATRSTTLESQPASTTSSRIVGVQR
jgi:acetyl esterase/lipase